jgi:hypothetical protein
MTKAFGEVYDIAVKETVNMGTVSYMLSIGRVMGTMSFTPGTPRKKEASTGPLFRRTPMATRSPPGIGRGV